MSHRGDRTHRLSHVEISCRILILCLLPFSAAMAAQIQWGNGVEVYDQGGIPVPAASGYLIQLRFAGADMVIAPPGSGDDILLTTTTFSVTDGYFFLAVDPVALGINIGDRVYTRVFNAAVEGSATHYVDLGNPAATTVVGDYSISWTYDPGGSDPSGADWVALGAGAPPSINATGVTNITPNSARLMANLTTNGGLPTAVLAYWGLTNPGTNAAAWQNTNNLGIQPVGPVFADISGLATSTLYYFRFRATNTAGSAWAPATTNFTTTGGGNDLDADGMDDAWEIANLSGTNAMPNADPDGDGFMNLHEFIAGTDPINPMSLLAMTDLRCFNGVTNIVSWRSAPGKAYTLFWTTNLLAGWSPTVTNIVAVPPTNAFADFSGASQPLGYYRVAIAAGTNMVTSVNALGFARVPLPTNSAEFVGWSFDTMDMGPATVQKIIGNQLSQGLTPALAEKIRVAYPGASNFASMARSSMDGQLHDISDWAGTATNAPLMPGMGFALQPPPTAAASHNFYVAGAVRSVPTQGVNIVQGYQLLAYPYSCDIPLHQTGLTNGTASAIAANADRIYIWNSTSASFTVYGLKNTDRQWHLVSNWGSPADTNVVIRAGRSFWYQSNSVSNFTWNVVCPYSL